MGFTQQFGTMGWIGLISPTMLIGCFYFTLVYFQYLKNGDERLIKQSRLAAVVCLTLAFLIPIFYNFYLINEMMQ